MAPSRLAGNWTLAVAGGKGGCGKTTGVLGLATALVRRGARPLVADADFDLPDLHRRADVDPSPGLADVSAGAAPIAVSQPSTRFTGVDVIPAGPGPPTRDRALRRVAGCDRPTLLDCPAGAGPGVAAPLRAADASILVTAGAQESLEDTRKTAEMARALGAPAVAALHRRRPGDPASGHLGGVAVSPLPEVEGRPLGDSRVRAAYDRALGRALTQERWS